MVWLFDGILDHPYMTKEMLMMTIPTATTTTIIEYSKWMNPRKKYSKVNFDIDGHLVDDRFCWRQYSFWLNQNRRFFLCSLWFLIAVTYTSSSSQWLHGFSQLIVNECCFIGPFRFKILVCPLDFWSFLFIISGYNSHHHLLLW